VPVLARAAVAVGVAGLFIETHRDPDGAPSDGPNMIALKDMEPLLERLMQFDAVAKTPAKNAQQSRGQDLSRDPSPRPRSCPARGKIPIIATSARVPRKNAA